MRPEMLQYIHKGHQGKERCLLRARNTIFWPKMTYDVQELIERCIICHKHGKSQPIIGTTQELPPFPWHTLATDMFYWKRMDFLIVADVFSKYFLVRKLANSTSAAVCAELSMFVTELGLPTLSGVIMAHATIPRSSSSFCNDTTSHTKPAAQTTPDPMDLLREWSELLRSVWTKLEKKGNHGSQVCMTRVTQQSGSIVSPLQLMTQCTPKEKDLSQFPSILGTQEMYKTQQELMKRQRE